MTDREILDHVYRELLAGRVHQEVIDFIQTEWQKRDEKEMVNQFLDYYGNNIALFSKVHFFDHSFSLNCGLFRCIFLLT